MPKSNVLWLLFLDLAVACLLTACAKQDPTLIPNPSVKAPRYRIGLIFTEDCAQGLRKTVRKDTNRYLQIDELPEAELQSFLNQHQLSAQSLLSYDDYLALPFALPADQLSVFYIRKGHIFVKSFNSARSSITDVEIGHLLAVGRSWLLGARTGWIWLDPGKAGLETYINQRYYGSSPMLLNLPDGFYTLIFAQRGDIILSTTLNIPFSAETSLIPPAEE